MEVNVLIYIYIYIHGVECTSIVPGTRVTGKDPQRGQVTKREQSSREVGGISHGGIFYESLHIFHGSKSKLYGSTFSMEFDESFRGSCWKVP